MTTRKERAAYSVYFFGQNIFYGLIGSFIMTFFTDIGLKAALATIVILIVKVWSAVADPFFGMIVDREPFKTGKYLPWLRMSMILIPFVTIAIFAIPSSLPTGIKLVWATVAYCLWATVYTMCDVPIFSLVTAMTHHIQERTDLITLGRIVATVGGGVALLLPSVREPLGGWLPTALTFSIIGALFMLPIAIAGKERVKSNVSDQEGHMSINEMLTYVKQNKYMMVVLATLTLYAFVTMTTQMGLYFARFNLESEALLTPLLVIGQAPAVIVGFFIPMLTKRIDKAVLFQWAFFLTGIAGIISYFVGYENYTLLMVTTMLRAIPLGLILMLMYQFTPDCAEYGTYVTGIQATGITFSLQTFTTKLQAALASAAVGILLAMIGFKEGVNAVQPDSIATSMWMIYTLVPALFAFLLIPVFRLYKLRDDVVAVMASANVGELTRDEAESQIAGKY
jgi:sugar (glycoside-pentoside-hexuronide) transporter